MRNSKIVNWLWFLYKISRSQAGRFAFNRFPIAGETAYPWLTMPANDFLDGVNLTGKKVLEFGAGYSTLYFDRRGAITDSFEREEEWFDNLVSQVSENTRLHWLGAEGQDYSKLIDTLEDSYDVLVIDVFPRPKFFETFFPLLHKDGFVVFDNSDWYPKFFASLRQNPALTVIDFSGYPPSTAVKGTTSIVYRTGAEIDFGCRLPLSPDHPGTVSEHDRELSTNKCLR